MTGKGCSALAAAGWCDKGQRAGRPAGQPETQSGVCEWVCFGRRRHRWRTCMWSWVSPGQPWASAMRSICEWRIKEFIKCACVLSAAAHYGNTPSATKTPAPALSLSHFRCDYIWFTELEIRAAWCNFVAQLAEGGTPISLFCGANANTLWRFIDFDNTQRKLTNHSGQLLTYCWADLMHIEEQICRNIFLWRQIVR